MSFTHVSVGTNNLEKARAFYDETLSLIGQTRQADLGEAGSIWGVDSPSFFVLKPANGEPATVGNGITVSFRAPDRKSIHAFHSKALELGAVDEGQPGIRGWAPNAYAAYVRDPDGNKLAVYCFNAE